MQWSHGGLKSDTLSICKPDPCRGFFDLCRAETRMHKECAGQDVSASILDSRCISQFTCLCRTDREPPSKLFRICLRNDVGSYCRFSRLSTYDSVRQAPISIYVPRILFLLELWTRLSPTGHYRRLRRYLSDSRLRNKRHIATRTCQ